MSLKEKVILVTGGAIRVGRMISRALGEASLILHYFESEHEAIELKKLLKEDGGRAEIFQADLKKRSEIDSLFKFVERKYGKIDVLVNNAASFIQDDFSNMELFEEILNLNFLAPLRCVMKVIPLINPKGSIINITDTSAKYPLKEFPSHSVSKAAIHQSTLAIKGNLGHGIRINNLMLGLVCPSNYEKGKIFDELLDKHVALGRPPTEEELQSALLFLINNNYVNGTTLDLAGGWHLD